MQIFGLIACKMVWFVKIGLNFDIDNDRELGAELAVEKCLEPQLALPGDTLVLMPQPLFWIAFWLVFNRRVLCMSLITKNVIGINWG